MTLLANGSFKRREFTILLLQIAENDSTQQLLPPFTPDQLRENYCQNTSKIQINTSQSEKIPI